MRFVTSMSETGYEEYGKTFLETFHKHCDLPLTVYSEDELPAGPYPIVDLNGDAELTEFLKNDTDSPDYRFQAGKFAKKVFAITSEKPDTDWLIWIDADVIVEKPITAEFLKSVCPSGMMGSYLGRKDWHHSECGWVAYNLQYAGGFLKDFREIYTSGEVFDHLEWHDSYLFDRLRDRYREKQGFDAWVNLSEGIPGMHVWDESPLGKVMRHLKGPLRKSGSKANVPESYWSERERA